LITLNEAPHSVGFLWTSDQSARPLGPALQLVCCPQYLNPQNYRIITRVRAGEGALSVYFKKKEEANNDEKYVGCKCLTNLKGEFFASNKETRSYKYTPGNEWLLILRDYIQK
jgi:hypothetical protein